MFTAGGVVLALIFGILEIHWHYIAPSGLPILSTQIERLTELERLFAGKNETDLTAQFDFDNLEAINIRMIRDRIIHVRTTGDKKNFSITPYTDGGGLLLATDIAGDDLSHTSHGGVLVPDFSRVEFIVLTMKYSNALKQLNIYEDSVTIPSDVISAVKELDGAVQRNARTLLNTLDYCLRQNPDDFMEPLSPPMGVIHERFIHSSEPLKSKVDKIVEASRRYLRVDN